MSVENFLNRKKINSEKKFGHLTRKPKYVLLLPATLYLYSSALFSEVVSGC